MSRSFPELSSYSPDETSRRSVLRMRVCRDRHARALATAAAAAYSKLFFITDLTFAFLQNFFEASAKLKEAGHSQSQSQEAPAASTADGLRSSSAARGP